MAEPGGEFSLVQAVHLKNVKSWVGSLETN